MLTDVVHSTFCTVEWLDLEVQIKAEVYKCDGGSVSPPFTNQCCYTPSFVSELHIRSDELHRTLHMS